jgi:hypothetical protein
VTARNFDTDLSAAQLAERFISAALIAPSAAPVSFDDCAHGGYVGAVVYREFKDATLLAFMHPDWWTRYHVATAHLNGDALSLALRTALNKSRQGYGLPASSYTTLADPMSLDTAQGRLYDANIGATVSIGNKTHGPLIEMKSDNKLWRAHVRKGNPIPWGTGNIFAEIEQWARKHGYPDRSLTTPSGLNTSQADTYIISLGNWETQGPKFALLINTPDLKKLVLDHNGRPRPGLHVTQGGTANDVANDNPTIGILTPIAALLNP